MPHLYDLTFQGVRGFKRTGGESATALAVAAARLPTPTSARLAMVSYR